MFGQRVPVGAMLMPRCVQAILLLCVEVFFVLVTWLIILDEWQNAQMIVDRENGLKVIRTKVPKNVRSKGRNRKRTRGLMNEGLGHFPGHPPGHSPLDISPQTFSPENISPQTFLPKVRMGTYSCIFEL